MRDVRRSGRIVCGFVFTCHTNVHVCVRNSASLGWKIHLYPLVKHALFECGLTRKVHVHGKYVYSTLTNIRKRKGNSERRDSLKKGERSCMLLCTCRCTCTCKLYKDVYIYTGSRDGLEKHTHAHTHTGSHDSLENYMHT